MDQQAAIKADAIESARDPTCCVNYPALIVTEPVGEFVDSLVGHATYNGYRSSVFYVRRGNYTIRCKFEQLDC